MFVSLVQMVLYDLLVIFIGDLAVLQSQVDFLLWKELGLILSLCCGLVTENTKSRYH